MTSYGYELDVALISTLEKLVKRDKRLYTAVQKKVLQVTENPYLGKPLKKKLKGRRRVHRGHFV
jgi:mRNA-degrading endonuclease RelE of RelBE toxin-antitoxin system